MVVAKKMTFKSLQIPRDTDGGKFKTLLGVEEKLNFSNQMSEIKPQNT